MLEAGRPKSGDAVCKAVHRGPELGPDKQSDYLTTSHIPAPRR